MQESNITGSSLLDRPLKLPCKKEVTLTNDEFAEIIDGNLEIVKLKTRKVAFIFDKDRDVLRLPLNRVVDAEDQNNSCELYGTFIVVGLDGTHNYTGLTAEQLRYFKNQFYLPAKKVVIDGKLTTVYRLLAE